MLADLLRGNSSTLGLNLAVRILTLKPQNSPASSGGIRL
jgi:hypothetical protein